MKHRRRTRSISTFIALILLLLTPSVASSNVVSPKDLISQPLYGAVIQESQSFQNISFVTALYNAKNGGQFSQRTCATFSTTDPHCLDADVLHANLVIPVCHAATDNFCIQGFDFLKSDGTKETASLLLEATTQQIPASSTFKTGAGGGVSIWSAPKSPHTGGSGTYMVTAIVAYSYMKTNPTISMDSFDVVVTPMDMINDAGARQARPCEKPDPNIGGNSNVAYGWNCADNYPDPASYTKCSQMLDGLCFMREDFLTGTKMSLSLRVDNRVSGWLFGRMSDTQVSVSPIDTQSNLLTVEGTAQSIPTLVGYVKKAELDKYPAIKTKFQETCTMPGFYTTCAKMLESDFFDGSLGSGRDRFQDFNLFDSQMQAYSGSDLDFKKDTNWSFGSTSYRGPTSGNGSCFADLTKLLGLVTTNAPVYESGPPNMTNGSLTYKVAGAHLKADGSLFKGTYDLAIRSEVARCIYGFSTAPIQATISVTSTDGSTSEVATETVSERDGWMRLSAANFTFSSPTIRIKLSQSAPIPVATPSKAPSAPTPAASVPAAATPIAIKVAPAKATASTITCVKGKSTKKVTSINPKCPVGFKKK
jgi:hypothetical protein